MAILPDTEIFEKWKSPSVPVYFSIYLFNLTNPDEVLSGQKPRFDEIGPYVYKEDRQKINISFSSENPPQSVKYNHRIFYYFVPELSVAPDDVGNFTILDIATATGMYNEMPFAYMVGGFYDRFRPFIHGTPKELVWGKPHWFVNYCYSMSSCVSPDSGIMANKNGTKVSNFVINTGAYNSQDIGKLIEFDGITKLDYWRTDYANMINGTDGSITRPDLSIGSRIYIFVPEFCRSFYSDAVEETVASMNSKVKLMRMASPPVQAQSASTYPPNAAFCPKVKAGPECPLTGMIPLSPCAHKDSIVPIFASQPHFLGADPSVAEQVEGLQEPNPKSDSTIVLIEPNTGLVLEAYKKVQINMYFERTDNFADVYQNFTGPLYWPLAWFSEVAVADVDTLEHFYKMIILPKFVVPIVFYVLGFLLAVFAGILLYFVKEQCHLKEAGVQAKRKDAKNRTDKENMDQDQIKQMEGSPLIAGDTWDWKTSAA